MKGFNGANGYVKECLQGSLCGDLFGHFLYRPRASVLIFSAIFF